MSFRLIFMSASESQVCYVLHLLFLGGFGFFNLTFLSVLVFSLMFLSLLEFDISLGFMVLRESLA